MSAAVIERTRVSQELRVASAAFSALGGAKNQKLPIQESDLPSLIPSGSRAKVWSHWILQFPPHTHQKLLPRAARGLV